MASDSSRTQTVARPPRLLLRFAVYTGVVLAAAGLAILWIVDHQVSRAEQRVENQSRAVAEQNMRRHVHASDFAAPVHGTRRATLDELFRKNILIPGVVGARLVRRDGTITYAARHQVIGTRVPYDDALAAAMAGRSSRRVTRIVTWRGERLKVLQALIPVQLRGSTTPLGALELDQDYRTVNVSLGSSRNRLALILGLAFLVLYLALFPILRRVTAQLEARNRLLENQAVDLSELAAIVESSDDAIVATDLQGDVINWNEGAQRVFGFEAEEMIGRSMSTLAPPDRIEEFREHLRRVARGDRVEQVETVRLRRDGSPIDVALTVSPLRDAVGAITGYAGILRDVTERKRQEAQREALLRQERAARSEAEAARADAETAQALLTEQNDRLRELDRMKDEFVSLVSHELRTPLTSIRGYLELMLEDDSELTPEHRRFLDVVDRNSNRLLDLVGDLLFLAQIDAGKLTIELDDVDLPQVVADSIEASQPFAKAKEIELIASVGPVPLLRGDRTRLAQVLDNLVSNALKFTPRGGRVTVTVEQSGDNAVLVVEDTGLGIPVAEQVHLFERFFRSSRATDNAIPGTGLGLTITKAIVERHGGRIALESEEDRGTKVHVELPVSSRQDTELSAHEVAA